MHLIKELGRRWLPVFTAFIMGVMLTGVATGHTGFGDLLHSTHNDTMNGTLTAKGFKFKTTKTSRVVVPGTAFLSEDGSGEPNRDTEGGLMTTTEIAVAPVYLPHGAQLVSLEWFHDPADTNWRMSLMTGDRAKEGSLDELAEVTATTCPDATEPCSDSDAISHTVNNRTQVYQLTVVQGGPDPSASASVYAAELTYKTLRPGPD